MRGKCVWVLAAALAAALAAPVSAQKALTPSETVLAFYGLMRQHKFKEAFSHSVYAEAVEGLGDEDLAELTPEFERNAADIPEKIDVGGEQSGAEVATVFVKFGGADEAQEVTLVKDGGRWLVGDRDALGQVRAQKTEFFFNTRIRVDHNEVFDLVRRITGSEEVAFQAGKAYATLDELAAKEDFGEDLKDGVANGYRFTVALTPDRQAYSVVAIPVRYGRTGKLSFFASGKSIHAADAGGRAVNEQAPVLVEDVFKNEQAVPQ